MIIMRLSKVKKLYFKLDFICCKAGTKIRFLCRLSLSKRLILLYYCLLYRFINKTFFLR